MHSHSRQSAGGESFRNIEEFDDARNPSGLHDEGRGLLTDGPGGSSRSVFSRDEVGEESALSSFNETLFNACNLLIGCGLLSLPYAMRLAGWFGVAVLLLFSAFTCYTAKILGRIQEYVPAKKLRDGPGAYTIYGFHDMGELVFGEYGKLLISVCRQPARPLSFPPPVSPSPSLPPSGPVPLRVRNPAQPAIPQPLSPSLTLALFPSSFPCCSRAVPTAKFVCFYSFSFF